MQLDDAAAYIGQLMDRLRRKQQRERAYLDRRASRGTRTPTDEAYEADQVLLEEVLSVLDEIYQGLLKEMTTP
jgi:hypothetical protein